MSETENQETNGTTNGDVPEIELIIKEKFINPHKTCKEDKSTSTSNDALIEQRRREQNQQDLYNVQSVDLQYPKYEQSEMKLLWNVSTSGQELTNINITPYFEKINSYSIPEVEVPSMQLNNAVWTDIRNTHMPQTTHGNNIALEQINLEKSYLKPCDCRLLDLEKDLDLNLKIDETDSLPSAPVTMKNKTKSNKVSKRYTRKCNPEDLQRAVQAVLEEGMSLGEAAKKFNVVKSTIWSRVSKNPKHQPRQINTELYTRIHGRLLAGDSIADISRSLHVAKSTIHQHKIRLAKKGLLPSSVLNTTAGSTGKYSEGGIHHQNLVQAYRAHRVNGVSVRLAAQMYSLPATTLWRYIKQCKNEKENRQVDCTSIVKTEPLEDEDEDQVEEKVSLFNAFIIKVDNTKVEVDTENTENIRPQFNIYIEEINQKDKDFLEEAMLNGIFKN